MKGITRAKRGKGVRRRVVGNASVPANWQNFLRVDSNKTEIVSFLSKRLPQKTDQYRMSTLWPRATMKKLIVVFYCTYYTLHSMAITRQPIRTVDTDVVVLAVFAIYHLPAGCKLWLAFVIGKSFRYLAALQIGASLGEEMS